MSFSIRIKTSLAAAAAFTLGSCGFLLAEPLGEPETWNGALNSRALGTLELVLDVARSDNRIVIGSDPEAARAIADASENGGRPANRRWKPAHGTFQIEARRRGDGPLKGKLTSPFGTTGFEFAVSNGAIEGATESGNTQLSATPGGTDAKVRDYPALAAALVETMNARVYDPAKLETPEWRAFAARLDAVARAARDDYDFLAGVSFAWSGEPFSHFRLWRPMMSTEDLYAQFIAQAAQAPVARYETHDADIGVITIDHFVGTTVTEQVNAAFAAARENGDRALIVDLRQNSGGEFAALKVVENLIAEPLELGHFLGANWWGAHDAPPTEETVRATAPFAGTTVAEFQHVIQTEELLVLRVAPSETRFSGPVAVLIGPQTASAAELIAEGLGRAKRATLIGGRTSGQLLSGDFFDLADGFKLFLPVADYITAAGERVEGVGVAPQIEVGEDGDAFETAVAHLKAQL